MLSLSSLRTGRAGASDRILLIPTLVFLFGIYAYPILRFAILSFIGPPAGFHYYQQLLQSPHYLKVLGRTFAIALQVVVICLCLGYPVAYVLSSLSRRLRNIMTLAILVPFSVSALVRTYAWMVILGRGGIVNNALRALDLISSPLSLMFNRFGVLTGMVHLLLPIMILSLYTVMRGIDKNLIKAAKSMGATPSRAFLAVYLPLSMPGVSAGSLLVFILSLGFYLTPALLGGLGETTFIILIEKQVSEVLNWGMASSMAVILLVGTLIIILIYQWVSWDTRRRGHTPGSELRLRGALRIRCLITATGRFVRGLLRMPSHIRDTHLYRYFTVSAKYFLGRIQFLFTRPDVRKQRPSERPVCACIAAGIVLLFLSLPVLVMFPLAFSSSLYLEFPPKGFSLQWFRVYFSRQDWIAATLFSVQVAVITMLTSTFLGTLGSLGLGRADFKGKKAAMAFIVSPMIVPTMIFSLALYYVFSPLGLVGSVTGLALGHTVLAIPVVIVIVSAALKNVDERLEQAAMSLGANRLHALWGVTIPLIRPAIFASGLLAFLTSFDDLLIALFLSGTKVATLPKRMWDGIRFETDPTIAAASTFIIVLAIFIVGSVELVRGRYET